MSADTLQPETSTRLQGKALFLARAGWAIVAALCLSLSTYHLIIYSKIISQPDFVRIIQPGNFSRLIPYTLIFVLYTVLAIFIFWSRSDDKMALLVSATLLTIGTAPYPHNWNTAYTPVPVLEWLDYLRVFFAFVSFLIFFSVFPDGRFILKRTSVIIGTLMGVLIIAMGWLFPSFPGILVQKQMRVLEK